MPTGCVVAALLLLLAVRSQVRRSEPQGRVSSSSALACCRCTACTAPQTLHGSAQPRVAASAAAAAAAAAAPVPIAGALPAKTLQFQMSVLTAAGPAGCDAHRRSAAAAGQDAVPDAPHCECCTVQGGSRLSRTVPGQWWAGADLQLGCSACLQHSLPAPCICAAGDVRSAAAAGGAALREHLHALQQAAVGQE